MSLEKAHREIKKRFLVITRVELKQSIWNYNLSSLKLKIPDRFLNNVT